MEERKKVYVTQGFIERLFSVVNDEYSSFEDIAKLLVFQPLVVRHLLSKANDACTRHGSFKKPTSIQGIIGILGFSRVADELDCIEYAPLCDGIKVRDQAIRCYVLASVYASLAEERFGKKKAPEHFLAGLIIPLVEDDRSILDECHDDLKDCFDFVYTGGIHTEGLSTVGDVVELIRGFEKGMKGKDSTYLYKVWYDAKSRAYGAIDISRSFSR